MKVNLTLCNITLTITYITLSLLMIYYLFSEDTQDDSNIVTEMNMWCDALENNLICAAKDHQLNDFLISLAPSVSVKYV